MIANPKQDELFHMLGLQLKRERRMRILTLLLYIVGIGLLGWADWRIAVGVVITIWAARLEDKT